MTSTGAQSPELLNQISQWRQKSIDGTLTLEEMRKAVEALRAGRISAVTEAGVAKRAAAKKTSTKASKEPPKSAEDLLGDLDKL